MRCLIKVDWKEEMVSVPEKREYGSTMILVILGILALYGGVLWLLVLIPAALFIWYVPPGKALRRSRN